MEVWRSGFDVGTQLSCSEVWVVSGVLDGWWWMFSRGTHGDLSAVSRLHLSAPVYDGQWPFIV